MPYPPPLSTCIYTRCRRHRVIWKWNVAIFAIYAPPTTTRRWGKFRAHDNTYLQFFHIWFLERENKRRRRRDDINIYGEHKAVERSKTRTLLSRRLLHRSARGAPMAKRRTMEWNHESVGVLKGHLWSSKLTYGLPTEWKFRDFEGFVCITMVANGWRRFERAEYVGEQIKRRFSRLVASGCALSGSVCGETRYRCFRVV